MDLDTAFEHYKVSKGELSKDEFAKVRAYHYSEANYSLADKCLSEACKSMPDRTLYPEQIVVAAKLICALGDRVPRQIDSDDPHYMWVLMESLLIQASN